MPETKDCKLYFIPLTRMAPTNSSNFTTDAVSTTMRISTIPSNITSPRRNNDEDFGLTSAQIFAICLAIVAFFVIAGVAFWYFGRRYKFGNWVRISRKNSLSNSRGQLDLYVEDSDNLHERPPVDTQLFSITDAEEGGGGGGSSVGDRRSRGTLDEDYFYDEIFERSAFTDMVTHKSIGELTSIPKEDELDEALFRRLSANV